MFQDIFSAGLPFFRVLRALFEPLRCLFLLEFLSRERKSSSLFRTGEWAAFSGRFKVGFNFMEPPILEVHCGVLYSDVINIER